MTKEGTYLSLFPRLPPISVANNRTHLSIGQHGAQFITKNSTYLPPSPSFELIGTHRIALTQ